MSSLLFYKHNDYHVHVSVLIDFFLPAEEFGEHAELLRRYRPRPLALTLPPLRRPTPPLPLSTLPLLLPLPLPTLPPSSLVLPLPLPPHLSLILPLPLLLLLCLTLDLPLSCAEDSALPGGDRGSSASESMLAVSLWLSCSVSISERLLPGDCSEISPVHHKI